MQDHELRDLVDAFHTKDDAARDALWIRLREHGNRVMPFFAELFPRARWFQVRRDIAFHAIRFARLSEAAFAIGRMAVGDKSGVVRYRGCCVLAYSLRPDALPVLEEHIGHADPQTVEHVRAAIDAIESRNHHYFVDRGHSGRSFWSVGGDAGDGDGEPDNQLPQRPSTGRMLCGLRRWFGRGAGA